MKLTKPEIAVVLLVRKIIGQTYSFECRNINCRQRHTVVSKTGRPKVVCNSVCGAAYQNQRRAPLRKKQRERRKRKA